MNPLVAKLAKALQAVKEKHELHALTSAEGLNKIRQAGPLMRIRMSIGRSLEVGPMQANDGR
jgi:hypothetical protein